MDKQNLPDTRILIEVSLYNEPRDLDAPHSDPGFALTFFHDTPDEGLVKVACGSTTNSWWYLSDAWRDVCAVALDAQETWTRFCELPRPSGRFVRIFRCVLPEPPPVEKEHVGYSGGK